MHKELRRYSSIGNKAGIMLLCKKMLCQGLIDLPSIKVACSFIDGVTLNFNCGIIALEELNLIEINGSVAAAKQLIFTDFSEDAFVVALCKICLKELIHQNLISLSQLSYNEERDAFQIPTSAFKLECAVFRNLLVTLGALRNESSLFFIRNEYEKIFSNIVASKKKLTKEKLLAQLEQEQIMGEEGEIFALNYERSRCPFTAYQQKRIKQISVVDECAGYDLISFHYEDTNKRRYIEVKTFKGKPHFYWSANEMNSARLRKDDYFIYLVDYSRINEDGYIPEMIKDPCNSIKDSEFWSLTPTSYLVERM